MLQLRFVCILRVLPGDDHDHGSGGHCPFRDGDGVVLGEYNNYLARYKHATAVERKLISCFDSQRAASP